MKTMFNKTLIALALTGVAGTASAATLTVANEHTVTKQYLAAAASATEAHTSASFVINLGAEYVLNDTITLTFNDSLKVPATNTIVTAPVADAPGPVAGKSGLTLSLISSTSNSLTYRVTAIDNTGVAVQKTTGVAIATPAIEFVKSKLASNAGVSVTFSAKTNTGLDLDTAGGTDRTKSLVKVVEQFTTVAPSFSKVIDVAEASGRKNFEGVDQFATSNLGVTTLTTAGNTFAQAPTKVTYTIDGDFSWVFDTDTTTAGIQPRANTVVPTNCAGLADEALTASRYTFSCTAVAANTNVKLDIAANKVGATAAQIPVLNTTDYTITATVAHTGGPSQPYNAKAAGSWTLNGSTVEVPYMVFGTLSGVQFSQVLQVTNSSSATGDIYVDVTGEDGKSILSNVKVGTSAGKSTVNVAGAVRTALTNAGFVNGKASLKLVTNVPANNVEVYSAYTDVTSRERAIVINSSN